MSKRSSILSCIETALLTITDIKHVEVNRATPIDIDYVSFPCAFIYSGPEERINDGRQVQGYETFDWTIQIEVYGNENTDMEDLLSHVHAQMFANYTFDGNANYSFRTGCDMLTINPERNIKLMILEYTVVYRHVAGSP